MIKSSIAKRFVVVSTALGAALVSLVAQPAWSRNAPKQHFDKFLVDQIQYVLCANRACPPGVASAVGQEMAAALAQSGFRTDFTAQSLGSAAPVSLDATLGARETAYIRSVIRETVAALAEEDASRTKSILDKLTDRAQPHYTHYLESIAGAGAHMQSLIELTQYLQSATSLQGLSGPLAASIVRQSFVVGGLRNPVIHRRGCPGSATPEAGECLTAGEVEAARRYMGHEFMQINDCASRPGGRRCGGYEGIVNQLNSLLRKLVPSYSISYRGIGPKDSYQKLQVGQVYSEPGFVSTSLNSRISQRFLDGAGLILFTKTCPVISGVGPLFDGEDEILCSPKTQFRVVHKEDRGGYVYLFMEQI